MTSQQAKLLLQACRPNGRDAQDPLYAEALEQVRRDPELARWFESEQRLDAAIGAKLKDVPVPANLKANCLALAAPLHSKPQRWRRPAWLAAAAVVALLLAVAASWKHRRALPEFAAFRNDVVQHTIADPQHIAFASRNMEDIRHWLQKRGVDAGVELPARLRAMTPHGCRVLDWKGEKVALICLVQEGQSHVDLVLIDRTRFRDFTASDVPQVGQHGDVATAVWSKGGKTCLLAGKMSAEQLRQLL